VDVIRRDSKIEGKTTVRFVVPFDVFLTVRLSITLVINQLNAQILVF